MKGISPIKLHSKKRHKLINSNDDKVFVFGRDLMATHAMKFIKTKDEFHIEAFEPIQSEKEVRTEEAPQPTASLTSKY